ncbi:MAG: extracellular solute-binding protein [Lachnospiraceae bacterium]|nr:extracellular solute-binding protein [Lachnospiraceae bacterium]
MKKKLLATLLAVALMATSLVGCGGKDDEGSKDSGNAGNTTNDGGSSNTGDTTPSGEKEDVTLVMWGAEEHQTMLRTMADEFIAAYADQANITVELGVQSEAGTKDTILTDPTAAADVFAFADDQINELVANKCLQPVVENTDAIIAANSAASIDAATVDGTLYAYPMTASNGYFMYYNKEYFTEEDVKTLDGMIAAAEAAGKQISMTVNDGWYIYSFFAGAGLTVGLEADGVTNYCTWNATDTAITGVDVANALLDICAKPGFAVLSDAEFATGVKDGSIIAGVNGTWNATTAQDAWGDNYAAVKLPTYTVAGQQAQMCSFAGFKLVGVSAYSEQPYWAMMLAEWITNETNQATRFDLTGEGPSNVNIAATDKVLSAPAIAALASQASYATAQRVGGNYWSPAQTFGQNMADGNPNGEDLQTLLDTMVEGITAPVQ